jgi:hypothetical protein
VLLLNNVCVLRLAVAPRFAVARSLTGVCEHLVQATAFSRRLAATKLVQQQQRLGGHTWAVLAWLITTLSTHMALVAQQLLPAASVTRWASSS